MGSSCEGNGKSIDSTVGGLVWVRRRNGSWWPGRILGPDELPESCLVSPRSGTPVKLLGREDASVDWYNLEKSKRVKAFRCGEYDECIEKAKVSASVSCKKAVKYARREDAILHALELESSRLSKDCSETCSEMEKPSGKQLDPVEETEAVSDKLSGLEYMSSSPQELSQGGGGGGGDASLEDPGQRQRTPNDSEEDPSALIDRSLQGRRRRALNDSEEDPSALIDHSLQGRRRRTQNDSEDDPSALIDHSLQGRRRRTPNDSEDDGNDGSKKRMRGLEDLGIGGTSSVKRRRSQVAHVHEFLKKKNRRRQLTKVLESTAMVTVPVMCEQVTNLNGSFVPNGSDNKASESKRSLSVVINNNSDSTGDATNNATAHACDISPTNCKQKDNEISSASGLLEPDSSVRLFDVPFIGEEKHAAGISPKLGSGKPQVGVGAQSGQSSLAETVSVGADEIQESGSVSSGAAGAGTNDISDRMDNKGTSKWQHKGKRNSRNKSKTMQKFLEADVLHDETDIHDPIPDQVTRHMVEVTTAQRLLPYRQSRFTVNPKYESSDLAYRKHDIGSLYDVNIEVKTGHRPQHVPYISLMSKLTGQPITGHPLVVEVVDDIGIPVPVPDGDRSLNGSECHSSSYELDGDVGTVQDSHGRSRKKARRNGVLSSNKKIRKLSSLTGSGASGSVSGSKRSSETGKFKKPGVACVPLKVVFGRINAALGISSSLYANAKS